MAYREKRLEEVRELMQQHINSLAEDLHAATEKATEAKREQITRYIYANFLGYLPNAGDVEVIISLAPRYYCL